MITTVSKTAAAAIAESLPLVESRRKQMEVAMSRHMALRGPFDPSKGRHRVTTGAIMDMLLDHAGRISNSGEVAVNERHALDHARLAIDGDHMSAFGDGLGAVMKDVLGEEATPAMLTAWGDLYWAVARMIVAAPVKLAA
jgi:nitric oxide dioxygenase